MARGSSLGLDWISIRYKPLCLLAAAALILGVLAVLFLIFTNPRTRAERSLSLAQKTLDGMALGPLSGESRPKLDEARAKIGQAREAFERRHYPEAARLADDARALLLSTKEEADSGTRVQAVLVDLEGSVSIKRSGQSVFAKAVERARLGEGDLVQTGGDGSARILYPDHSHELVYPDSLMAISSMAVKPDGGRKVESEVRGGKIGIQTPPRTNPHDENIVNANGVLVSQGGDSEVVISTDQKKAVEVELLKGDTSVSTGGREKKFALKGPGLAINVGPSGEITSEPLAPPPPLLSPKDREIVCVEEPDRSSVTFQWKAEEDSRSCFQVSTRASFSAPFTRALTVSGSRIALNGVASGIYFWRVRSDGDEARNRWSPAYRLHVFKVTPDPGAQKTIRVEADVIPCQGGIVLAGRTEAGVLVSANGIEVPVDPDGSFRTTLLFPELGGRTLQVRAFDAHGNETILRKPLVSSSE